MDFYKGVIPIFDMSKEENVFAVNPAGVTSGGRKRDYDEYPESMMAGPESIAVVPESEYDARYDEQEATESSLEHLFLRGGKPAFTNLDQNKDGDCWAYSTGHGMMFSALRDNREIPRLNPHFIATYLNRFQGGWCGASMDVALRIGCCEQGDGPDQWPLWSHDRRLLTPARLAGAAKHRVVEGVYDLTRQVWSQKLTQQHLATCGFTNTPAPTDYNEMSHSMCQIRWVRVERGHWCPLIINSWKNWGRFGLGVLRNMDADGGVAIRVAS